MVNSTALQPLVPCVEQIQRLLFPLIDCIEYVKSLYLTSGRPFLEQVYWARINIKKLLSVISLCIYALKELYFSIYICRILLMLTKY